MMDLSDDSNVPLQRHRDGSTPESREIVRWRRYNDDMILAQFARMMVDEFVGRDCAGIIHSYLQPLPPLRFLRELEVLAAITWPSLLPSFLVWFPKWP